MNRVMMKRSYKNNVLLQYRQLYRDTIIDAHNHIGTDLEGVVQEPRSLMRKMEQARVDRCVIFPFNEIKPGKAFSTANNYIARVVAAHPDRFIGFARTDPNDSLAAEEIRRAIKKLGLKGLKLHPRSQLFSASDRHVIPVLEECVKLKVPVLFHSGYAYSPIPPTIAHVADLFPELVILMGHMGCSEVCTPTGVHEAIRVARANDNVYLETSRVMVASCITEAVRAIGEERVIFGSDTPYGSQIDEIATVLSCGFRDSSLSRIFYRNLGELLRISI
ncbi:MAG: amidohydrolase family protein [Halobacteriota archaeon]